MFLNYIKEFFVKKSLKNNLNIVKNEVFTSNIQTVGLLVDETQFRYSKELIKELKHIYDNKKQLQKCKSMMRTKWQPQQTNGNNSCS